MRKTGFFTRLLSLILMAAMIVPMLPLMSFAEGAPKQYGYIVIEEGKKDRWVYFRPQPTQGDYIARLDEFTVVEVTGSVNKAGVLWYTAVNPADSKAGYIMASFVQLMTEEEQAAWLLNPTLQFAAATPTPTPTPTPTAVPGTALGYVRVTEDKVNLRQEPAGTVLNEFNQISLGTVLAFYEEVKAFKGYDWVRVVYDGMPGYIRSNCYKKSDVNGNILDENGATAAPGTEPTIAPETVKGYVKLVVDNVYIRHEPAGTVINEHDKMPLGKILAYTDGPVYTSETVFWVKVNYNGMTGYVRNNCFEYCDENGVTLEVTPSPTPSATPDSFTELGEGAYGRTVMADVMFRKTMSVNGDYWARLPMNWVVKVIGSDTKGGILWYKVQSGTPTNPTRTHTGYIHSGYLTIVQGGATEAPSATSDYGAVIINAINVRQAPSSSATALTALTYNTLVNIITHPAGTSANDWYYIEINGIYGYVEATALRVLSQSELPNVTLPATPAPSATPSPTPAFTGTGYVKTIKENINIRKTPAGTVLTPTNATRVQNNLVLAYSEGPTEKINGYYWVKINYNGIEGYIRSDCYVECNADGSQVVPKPTATPAPDTTGQTYIRLIKNSVNVRSDAWGTSYGMLKKGTVLPYFSTKHHGSETWYQVYSSDLGVTGYVLGTMAVRCDVYGNEVTVTPPPVAPGATMPPSATFTGYVATLKSSVWVRSAANATASTVGKVMAKGTVLPMTGAATQNTAVDPYTWYPIRLADGTPGYIRGDMVFELVDWQLDYYNQYGTCPTPTPGPATPPPGNSDYIITTGDKLWVRASASTKADTYGQLPLGTVIKFESKKPVGQIYWYKISFNGYEAWLHGNFVRVLSNAEYYQWMAGQPTPTPTPTPAPLPDPSTWSDLILTTADRVKIRRTGTMSGTEVSMVYQAGSQVTYLGNYTQPTSSNEFYWFNVKYGGVSGWMRGDFLRILTTEEKRLYTLTGNPDAPKEATYTTLKKGDSNEAVKKLQQALADKGYLAASEVTGNYLTSTEQAVIAFQQASGLTTDGIAGEQTQHALYNTVPEGTYDGSTVTPTLYPVETNDWFTGDIRNVWKVGMVAVLTDVYTGISFRVQHLYGDNHADAEPLTATDTAAFCQVFGVSNAQEVSDRESELQSWRRRPLWITVGGRTFAASWYPIPHNYPDGDRIKDNNFNGQFCIHFTNSMTHGTEARAPYVDWGTSYNGKYNGGFGHQNAILYAYNNSQSGKK